MANQLANKMATFAQLRLGRLPSQLEQRPSWDMLCKRQRQLHNEADICAMLCVGPRSTLTILADPGFLKGPLAELSSAVG